MVKNYYSITEDNDSFPRHMHNGYEMLFFLRGDVEFTLGTSVYRLAPGDFILIPPRVFHSAARLSDALYERIVFHFNEEDIPECARETSGRTMVLSLPEEHFFSAVFRHFAQCNKLYTNDELELLMHNMVQILLLQLRYMKGGQAIESIRNNPLMSRILIYINSHPCDAVTMESIAARFYVSKSWISHNFSAILGFSFTQYVRKNRILYAQSCIRAGENATDVAKKCGYESYVTFFRQYKQVIGHSPREEKTGPVRN